MNRQKPTNCLTFSRWYPSLKANKYPWKLLNACDYTYHNITSGNPRGSYHKQNKGHSNKAPELPYPASYLEITTSQLIYQRFKRSHVSTST